MVLIDIGYVEPMWPTNGCAMKLLYDLGSSCPMPNLDHV